MRKQTNDIPKITLQAEYQFGGSAKNEAVPTPAAYIQSGNANELRTAIDGYCVKTNRGSGG